MEQTARRLFEALRQTSQRPSLRVFVIGEDHFLRIIDGRYSWSEYSHEFGYADVREFDRGRILAAFSKLEFLINECLAIYMLDPNSLRFQYLTSIVNKLSFKQRVESLKECEVIGAALEKKLKRLSTVRNGLAHEWDKNSVKFDGNPLNDPETFSRFRTHLKRAFESLVSKYRSLQHEVNYESYLLDQISRIEQSGST